MVWFKGEFKSDLRYKYKYLFIYLPFIYSFFQTLLYFFQKE